METNNWRNEESRQKIVNKIVDTLQRHMPQTGADGMNELKKIALRFEEKIYTVAMSQQDYLRKISLKMLSLESKANGSSNHFPGSSPGNNQWPLDPGGMMLRTQIRNQPQAPGNSLPFTGQSQPQQPMLQQNLQNSISAGGMPSSAGLAPSLSSIPNGLPPMQGMPHNSINSSTSQVLPPLLASNQRQQLQSRQQQLQQHQLFQHQLQHQQQAIMNKKLQQQSQLQPSILQQQQSALPQSQLQPSQQAMLQPAQQPALQSTQQSILQQSQPSILQPAQQSVLQSTQQSAVQQASQTPLQQHQQSMLRQQQSQQSVLQQQQQSSMVQQSILQPQQQHQQQQHQQLLGQQNMQQQQQQHQHQIQQLLQSKHQQTQQASSSLLQSQSQQLQQQSQQQQLLSQLQSQNQPLQQQQRLLQQPNPMQQEMQRLQTTGGLLQQQQPSSIEQQKQLLQPRGLPEASSTSMESSGQTGQPTAADWQEKVYQRFGIPFLCAMATVTTVPAVDAIINPVMQLLKDVIKQEDKCQILQTDLRAMESLVQDIAIFFRFQQKELSEMVKVWLQLLHNSLTEAKGLLTESQQRRRCLDSVVCNPGRLSEKIRAWRAFFNHLFERFESDWFDHFPLTKKAMATVTAALDAIINPVMQLLKDVIKQEDKCQILQTDLRAMASLVQDIAIFFRFQQKELPEMVKVWFQLLHKSLTEVKGLLTESQQRQRYLDCVVRNPGRLSQKIRAWKSFFNHIFERFESNWFDHIPLSGNSINWHMDGPVIKLLEGVINKEDDRQILKSYNLRRMERLLQDITTLFSDEPDITTLFQRQKRELLNIVKNWLQLLQNSVTEADRLLNRLARRRIFGRECVVCQPRNLSKEIREWRASFDNIYYSIQSELSICVTSPEFILLKPLYEKKEIFPQEASTSTSSEFGGSGLMEAQDQVEKWLNEGDHHVHVIGVYGMPRTGKTHLLQLLCNKYKQVGNVFQHVILITVSQNYEILKLQESIADEIDLSLPSSFDERKMELSAYLKEKNFLLLLDDLWSHLDLQEVGVAFGDDKHSKVVFSTRRKDLIPEMSAQQYSTEIQLLSKDERWNLFRRVAFKDEQVSMDIEDRARQIANHCKGLPVAVNVVAAAMVGKTSVGEWDDCLSSIKKVDPSFPATHPRLDAELYGVLRYAYDSLPNSDLRRCFLYCAMYKQDEEINVLRLLHMWIGEGLVKSKQGSYLMDTAIGHKYFKLMVDRCLFQRVEQSTGFWNWNRTRVDECIHDMAVYIGQKEENCLFMANQNQRNFPELLQESLGDNLWKIYRPLSL